MHINNNNHDQIYSINIHFSFISISFHHIMQQKPFLLMTKSLFFFFFFESYGCLGLSQKEIYCIISNDRVIICFISYFALFFFYISLFHHNYGCLPQQNVKENLPFSFFSFFLLGDFFLCVPLNK